MQMICLPRGRWQLRGWALVWPQGQKPLPEGQVPRRKAFRARHNLGVHLNVCHLERKKCPSFGAAFSLWGVGHRRRRRGLLQMVFSIHDYKKVETGNTFFDLQQQRKIKWNFSSSLWSVCAPRQTQHRGRQQRNQPPPCSSLCCHSTFWQTNSQDRTLVFPKA